MTREEAKTSSLLSRKDYRSERIYRSLESFVGGRIRDIDYRLSVTTSSLQLKGYLKDGDGDGTIPQAPEISVK
ncbi:hypothetical protein Tco_0672180 [Tanacetum coccineum]